MLKTSYISKLYQSVNIIANIVAKYLEKTCRRDCEPGVIACICRCTYFYLLINIQYRYWRFIKRVSRFLIENTYFGIAARA